MNRTLTAACCAVALLAFQGCRGPSYTIRELGQPEFEAVVGDTTRFHRADPDQLTGLDAFTDDVQDDAAHTFIVSFWPISDEEKVLLEVRAKATGPLELTKIASAVYPATAQEAATFTGKGKLPAADAIALSDKFQRDEQAGNLVHLLLFDRDKIPSGTEKLVIPTLFQFADGWIHVRFYQTAIPDPIRRIDPADVERMPKAHTNVDPPQPAEPQPAGTPQDR